MKLQDMNRGGGRGGLCPRVTQTTTRYGVRSVMIPSKIMLENIVVLVAVLRVNKRRANKLGNPNIVWDGSATCFCSFARPTSCRLQPHESIPSPPVCSLDACCASGSAPPQAADFSPRSLYYIIIQVSVYVPLGKRRAPTRGRGCPSHPLSQAFFSLSS